MRRWHRRELVAAVVALCVHVGVMLRVDGSEVRSRLTPTPATPVSVTFVPAPPPVPPPAPEPAPEPPAPAQPKPAPPPTVPPPTVPVPTPPTLPVPTTPPTLPVPTTPTADAPSLMRLPTGPSTMDQVLGSGAPLGLSRSGLEGALDLRADGPMSDKDAAAKKAKRALQADLADDAVTAGLADDYFRELRWKIETAWQPATAQLNDGGQSTTQMGMMGSLVQDSGAWGEMWKAYMDLAKQYANGVQPKLETQRIERLRELMRSRRGAFRVQAISEVQVTQDASGKVLLLEFPLTSGHPGVDDGMREAITRAIEALPEPPPQRLSHGRSFSSWWRLRATWTMVPPTAFLSGASFDITAKGFDVDVPFQIKLKTNVMLLRTDGRMGVDAATNDSGAPE